MHPTFKFLCALLPALPGMTTPTLAADDTLLATVRAVETRLGGRVGIFVQDTGSKEQWTYRTDEHFPISSTFKPFACAAVLSRIENGEERLHRIIEFGEDDLVTYSPVTKERVTSVGMSIAELCEATLTMSDNTAGNLILESLGGPKSLTDYMRALGDDTTRLDRWEPDLNEGTPGDRRDTTSPRAAARSLHSLVLGHALTPSSREQLSIWMENDKVADALLRAALPENWRIADKSGAGGYGARSIIAIMWPPEGAPIITAIYLAENEASFADRNNAIAEIGAAIVAAWDN